MDPLTIALIAAGGKALIGGVKAIAGGIQKRRAQRELDKEMPKYSRPAEFDKLLSIFQQQAGLSELPGQAGIEAKLSTNTARGIRAVGKFSDNPVAAVAATAGLYGREQGAIRDLGIQFAEFKNRAQGNLANAYKMGADYSDKEWWQNVSYPDQVRRNTASQRWNGGQQNLWSGIDQVAGAGVDALTAGLNAQQGNPQQAPSAIPGNPAAVGSPNPTDAYGYYNPNLAGQFVPSFGTQLPVTQPGSNWGQWGSWTPNNG